MTGAFVCAALSIVPTVRHAEYLLPDGSAGIANGISQPGGHVELRPERDVLAVLSNCPQMHNPCNGYNPTPIQAVIHQPSQAPGRA
jgi:uncharacterized protein YcgI (DUF1989 family)